MADTLSKRGELGEETEGFLALISFPTSDWLDKLKNSYEDDPELTQLI